jgi:hypothetical protein
MTKFTFCFFGAALVACGSTAQPSASDSAAAATSCESSSHCEDDGVCRDADDNIQSDVCCRRDSNYDSALRACKSPTDDASCESSSHCEDDGACRDADDNVQEDACCKRDRNYDRSAMACKTGSAASGISAATLSSLKQHVEAIVKDGHQESSSQTGFPATVKTALAGHVARAASGYAYAKLEVAGATYYLVDEAFGEASRRGEVFVVSADGHDVARATWSQGASVYTFRWQ